MQVGVGLEAVQAMSSLVLLESLELPECCKLTDHAMPSLAQLTGKHTTPTGMLPKCRQTQEGQQPTIMLIALPHPTCVYWGMY